MDVEAPLDPRDQQTRARVVEAHLPLIAAMARRYQKPPLVSRAELIQEGVAGLLETLERYDPSRGASLWTYARPTVERSMQRLVAELTDAARLSDHALRRLSRLRDAEQELMSEQHRLPTRAEIIERSGLDRDAAEQVFAGSAPARSLQEPITADDGGVIGVTGDLVTDPSAEDAYEQVLDEIEDEALSHELPRLLSVLSDRERAILEAHFGLKGEPQSYREIAERLGLSVNRVRQIERRALAKLRRAAAQVAVPG
jgi:RNA polymerase sigma factor (sigma-70 family)